jgi:hypothetical protein
LKPEQWGSPLVQGKYQGAKAYDKRQRIIFFMDSPWSKKMKYYTKQTVCCAWMASNSMDLLKGRYIRQILQLTETFARDINMSFGLENCKMMRLSQGKPETKRFEMECGDTIEPTQEKRNV